MAERVPLPRAIAGGPFSYRAARALDVGEGRLRNDDLDRPWHGVRVPVHSSVARGIEPATQHAFEFAPLLRPGLFFSHFTAAALWGVPGASLATQHPLHVTAIRPAVAPRMPGLEGHHAMDGGVRVVDRHGLPVSDPVTTWISLASLLSHEELVVAGDHFVFEPRKIDAADVRPYATLDQLRAATLAFTGRGARNAKRSIGLVRTGSASRTETLLRLLLLRARFPDALLNQEVFDAHDVWLGRADLVWPEWKVIAEYDGDQHRTDTKQYERDISRIDRFIEAGWQYIRVRKHGLFVDPRGTVARVARAFKRAGWEP